jgi:hypothetical protein
VDTFDTFSSCNKIAWRWITVSGAGDDSVPVKGIDVFEIDGRGKIRRTYAEFNSGGWLQDLGNPECSS